MFHPVLAVVDDLLSRILLKFGLVEAFPHFTQKEAVKCSPRFPAAEGKVTLDPVFAESCTAFPNLPAPKLAGLETVPLCEPKEGEAVLPLASSKVHQLTKPSEIAGNWRVDPLMLMEKGCF